MNIRTPFLLPIMLATAGFTAHSIAQTAHDSHGTSVAAAAPTGSAVAMDEGIVKKIDRAAGKVTLAHGALSNGMPAMTMVYRVKASAWPAADSMQVGQKIRFLTDPADGGMTVSRFEMAR